MLILNSDQSNDNGTYTLTSAAQGVYELIDSHVDYHTVDAINYTCNTFIYEHSNAPGEQTLTLPSQTDLDVDALVAFLNGDGNFSSGLTATNQSGKLRLYNSTTEPCYLRWSRSSSRVLFKGRHADESIISLTSLDFEFNDRTIVKYYGLSFDKAYGRYTSSNDDFTPDLLLSGYSASPTPQYLYIPALTSDLTFTFRELESVNDLNYEDVPSHTLVFKKTS